MLKHSKNKKEITIRLVIFIAPLILDKPIIYMGILWQQALYSYTKSYHFISATFL